MPAITFITGGARSGKSRYALALARDYATKAFVATAEPLDDEMRVRIARHKRDRDPAFTTVEAPRDVAAALAALPADMEGAVIDCLTVWLSNLLQEYGPDATTYPELERFLELLAAPPCDLIVVSNEVGMGIVPDNAMARHFRDLAGSVNEKVAALSDRVILMVSGLPLVLKGNG